MTGRKGNIKLQCYHNFGSFLRNFERFVFNLELCPFEKHFASQHEFLVANIFRMIPYKQEEQQCSFRIFERCLRLITVVDVFIAIIYHHFAISTD